MLGQGPSSKTAKHTKKPPNLETSTLSKKQQKVCNKSKFSGEGPLPRASEKPRNNSEIRSDRLVEKSKLTLDTTARTNETFSLKPVQHRRKPYNKNIYPSPAEQTNMRRIRLSPTASGSSEEDKISRHLKDVTLEAKLEKTRVAPSCFKKLMNRVTPRREQTKAGSSLVILSQNTDDVNECQLSTEQQSSKRADEGKSSNRKANKFRPHFTCKTRICSFDIESTPREKDRNNFTIAKGLHASHQHAISNTTNREREFNMSAGTTPTTRKQTIKAWQCDGTDRISKIARRTKIPCFVRDDSDKKTRRYRSGRPFIRRNTVTLIAGTMPDAPVVNSYDSCDWSFVKQQKPS